MLILNRVTQDFAVFNDYEMVFTQRENTMELLIVTAGKQTVFAYLPIARNILFLPTINLLS